MALFENKTSLRIAWIVMSCIVAALAIHIGRQIPTRYQYESLRKDASSRVFEACEIDEADQRFIDEVTETWSAAHEECPEPVHARVSKTTGLENNVSGLVTLYSYEIRPYSFLDLQRNEEESKIAQAFLSMWIAPECRNWPLKLTQKEREIHYKQGFAYRHLSDDLVQVYEDTDIGIKSVLYMKPKEIE